MRKLLILASAAIAAGAGLQAQLTPEILKPKADPVSAMQYDNTKKKAAVAIREGRSEEAVKLVQPLTVAAPDDIDAWYILAQAYRVQGKLEAAEKTTQWMLDLRPEFVGGIWEAGLLREQFKDLEGSLDLLNDVYHRIPDSKAVQKIDVLTDIARVLEKKADLKTAEIIRKEIVRLKEKGAADEKAAAATVPQ